MSELLSPIPPSTLAKICAEMPCTTLFGVTVAQPSSTVLVIVLALEFFIAGILVGVQRRKHMACVMWCASFVTWGIACCFAAVSHQAFTWQARCQGRDKCLTEEEDLYNLVYLWLQNWALDLFVVARAYRASRRLLPFARTYCLLNGAILGVVMYYYADSGWRKFENILLFSFPTWLWLFVINRMYLHDWTSTGAWLTMGLSFGFFKLVQALPFHEWYTHHGIWFTDNDALHVGNMLFAPIAYLSASHVKDAPKSIICGAAKPLSRFGKKVEEEEEEEEEEELELSPWGKKVIELMVKLGMVSATGQQPKILAKNQ